MARVIKKWRPPSTKDKLRGFASVFSRVNSILTGEDIPTQFVSGSGMGQIAAWSTGNKVFFNETVIGRQYDQLPWGKPNEQDELIKFMASLTGANYHEDCHILFTPRMGTPFRMELLRLTKGDAKKGPRPTVWQAFQMLEDQRIEAMFWAMYPPVESYFQYMVGRWVLVETTKSGEATSHLFLYGRRYLDYSLRSAARDLFLDTYGDSITQEAQATIDAYMHLRELTTGRAIHLVLRFAKLLERINDMEGTPSIDPTDVQPCGHSHPGSAEVFVKGEIDPSQASQARQQAIDAVSEVDEADAERDDEVDSNRGEEGDEPASDVAPTSNDSDASTPPDLKAEAEKMLKDIINDADFVEDVQRTVQAARTAFKKEDHVTDKKYLRFTLFGPSPQAVVASRRAVGVLRQLQNELEPTWIPREPHGLPDMNVIAGVREDSDDDVCRRWEEGALEDSRLETVVCLDLSYSMKGTMRAASEAMWVVKRMHDSMLLPCTVLGFSTDWGLLYRAHERAGQSEVRIFNAHNDTYVANSLKESLQIVRRSKEPTQAVIVITDGDFTDKSLAQQEIARLKGSGAVVAILGLDGAVNEHGTHGAHIAIDVDDVMGVVKFTERLVSAVMRSARMNV